MKKKNKRFRFLQTGKDNRCEAIKKAGTLSGNVLERKIYTFWERNHIFGIRIPVAGGNELSVCLSELKVPEDSQQEAGY